MQNRQNGYFGKGQHCFALMTLQAMRLGHLLKQTALYIYGMPTTFPKLAWISSIFNYEGKAGNKYVLIITDERSPKG